jgi:hypothetical protein
MNVGWQFERGKTPLGETVPIKCRFVVAEEQGIATTSLEFVISEEAAQSMLTALAECANPPSDLVVASHIPEHPEQP